ncbi:MAG: hypothetical protein JXJ17_05100 [Anaerolineae bacterium]|nr:hypothetical protein [Anaerolineae bacterium]
MSDSSRPGQFAAYSYYLAFASSGIMLIAFVASMLKSPFFNIVWLALITGAVGTFFAMAARSDFKRKGASPEDEQRARVGFRVNLATSIFMILLVIFMLIVSAIPGLR